MDKKELRRLLEEALDEDIDAKNWDPGATIGMPTFISSSSIHTPSGKPGEKAEEAAPVSRFVTGDDDHYSVIEVLGRGGLGVVYRARQETLGRDVAIKSIRKKRQSDAIANEAFLSEAVITGILDHPNIVPVHDLIRTPTGETAIAMKLVNGISWMDLLHPKTEQERAAAADFTLARHLDILLSVGNAVAFAHAKGIIHRDLKPSNVMVGAFGEVVVMDWGMAVVYDADLLGLTDGDSVSPRLRESITHPGGSPGYMAPEMAQSDGSLLGPGTDIYLLGSILYEVLTGRRPHDGESLYQVVKAAFQSKPPPFPEDTPEGLKAICLKAMSRKINDRFATVEDFQRAIREHLRHRESHALVAEADGHRARFEALDLKKRLSHEPTRLAGYAALSDAVAGYRQALVLHPGNEVASQRGEETRFLYARTAFSAGDYGIARTQLEGLKSDEARALDNEVALAIEDRDRTQRSAHRLRVGLIAAAVTLMVGLAAGIIVIYREKTRADRLAISSQENLRTAEANAAEAEDQARRREKAAALAAANAEKVQEEAQAKLAALESREREKERADAMARKAQAKSLDAEISAREADRQSKRAAKLLEEAKQRASEAEESAERAREAQRVAAASLQRVQAEATAKEKALTEVEWLADVLRLQNLESRAKVLQSQSEPDLVDLDRWLVAAGALCSRQDRHAAALEEINAEVAEHSGAGSPKQRRQLDRWREELVSLEGELATAIEDFQRENLEDRMKSTRQKIASMRRKLPKPRRLQFPNEDVRWRHEILGKLVRDLKRFAAPGRGTRASMQRFAEQAHKKAPRKSSKAGAWPSTLRQLARSRRYGGLRLAPQAGLAPLGRDPATGYFEFLHLASHRGPIPVRDSRGRLAIGRDTGVVLVLLPPGQSMGSLRPAAVDDPEAGERPAARFTDGVPLEAFLVARNPLTRDQWCRLENHLGYDTRRPADAVAMAPVTDLVPSDLENLREVGLSAPANLQRRYAERLLGTSRPSSRAGGAALLGTPRSGGDAFPRGLKPVMRPRLAATGEGWGPLRARLARDPRFKKLPLSRNEMLLPLGRDATSGLEEFLHLPSHGEAPRTRGPDGHLPLESETGIVFVLVPGGRFTMGSQTSDPVLTGYDTEAKADEMPRHEVRLEAFLLAKHELTRGQWRRLTGRPAPEGDEGNPGDLHPATRIGRFQCEALRRFGLTLPTESQWEYAARGGTEGVWWWDEDLEVLRDHVNLADLSHVRERPDAGSEGWNDGHPFTAPAGTFPANPFGLHEIAGNVSEWVRDQRADYDRRPRGPEGLRRAAKPGINGLARGASYLDLLEASRLAARHPQPPRHRSATIGLRPLFRLRR